MPNLTPLQRNYADSSPPTSSCDLRTGHRSPLRPLSRSEGTENKWESSSPEHAKSILPEAKEEPSFRWDFGGILLRPLGSTTLQTQLTVNEPGDAYEQEADRVADHVMRASQNVGKPNVMPDSTPTVRRACACGGTCSKCMEDEEHGRVQRKPAATATRAPASAPAIVSEVLNTSGHALDPATRAYMEPRFGYDFSNVRVHSDELASASTRAVQARAYTVGRHIVFSNREPSPQTPAAWPLMAHELAHVIQQQSAWGRLPFVMRAPDKETKPAPPPPTPCTINCTDAKFLALSPADRETQFTTQCPSGFPLDTTFFSQSIPGATSAKLKGKLLAAAARAKRLMCINGKDPNAYQLDRIVKTYSTHSPSESRAVDIDY